MYNNNKAAHKPVSIRVSSGIINNILYFIGSVPPRPLRSRQISVPL